VALDLNAPRHFFMMLANLSVERPPAGRLGMAVISVRSRISAHNHHQTIAALN
jgi:hypothetical protein